MRIGLVIYGSLDTLSGGYLYDQKLVQHLRADGHIVEIHSIPWRGYARHLLDNFSISLRRSLASAGYDILLEDELNHPSLFWANKILKNKVHTPIVAIVHHLRSSEARPEWQNRLYRPIERAYLRSLDAMIYNSQTTRKAVERLSELELPHVVAYPAGDRFSPQIDLAEIVARAHLPGSLRILFLGNIIPRKGLSTLLQAVAPIPHNLWELKVAGSLTVEPAYTHRVRRWAVDHGLADNVRFMGSLNEAQLAEQMRNSHILAVPSSYEGFGIAYLEGMSFGLPAIATTGGAAGEIITSGQDGFLVSPGDAETLREHLKQLIENRGFLAQLSEAARKRFQAHPGWQDTTAKIAAFLEKIAARQFEDR
jgi:glycosyltransferase involved in cell wall biosynthesis